MHVALVGTYPPTACGIATFTADVEHSLAHAGADVTVFAVHPSTRESMGSPLRHAIVRDDRSSYEGAAMAINGDKFDVVLVQHEFGIFGGSDGAYLLDLVDRLTVPVVLTLHTVLSPFSSGQIDVMQQLCQRSAAVTVFTATARRLLLEQEILPASNVRVVPHGAPLEMYGRYDAGEVRRQLGLHGDNKIITTFGLLSPGKGIELAIEALADVVAAHPETVYVVAGRTHPEVARRHGESYRAGLTGLIDELDLGEHVVFLDRFLTVRELAELLSVTDVFCTPYSGSDQIVSGALTFAVAAGCPTVSTPYRYARDLLGDGAGILVDFGDAGGFARAVVQLLDDGPVRSSARSAAHHTAESMTWPAVGRTLARLLNEVAAPVQTIEVPAARIGQTDASTPSSMHLRVLVDDTAIFQHARSMIPRHEHGYCVDDVGRLLPLLADLASRSTAEEATHWHACLARQLAFLRAAAGPRDGTMRNFMSWDRRWLDEPHEGDHVGRAIWGLGELAAAGSKFSGDALELMVDLIDGFDLAAAPPRTLVYGTLGLVAAGGLDQHVGDALEASAAVLRAWAPSPNPAWRWVEPSLTYDNARLAEVLLRVGRRRDDAEMTETGTVLLGWLEQRCMQGGHYRFPGHLGVDAASEVRWSGDEQPLEAAAMADAHAALWATSRSRSSLDSIERAWSWFLGNNRLGLVVGDITTGACFDGLSGDDVNRNCGAESTIAFHRCALTRRLVRLALVEQHPATERPAAAQPSEISSSGGRATSSDERIRAIHQIVRMPS